MSTEILKNQEVLPIIIDSPYPYLAIGDIQEVVKRVAPSLNGPVVNGLQEDLFTILETMSPPKTSFYSVLLSEIDRKISRLFSPKPNTATIIMDRYLSPPPLINNTFRLEISRKTTGGLVARPGASTSPEKQTKNLTSWLLKNRPQEIILVDDVLAFGDTSIPLIKLIQERLLDTKITLLAGIASSGGTWSGVETVKQQTGIDVQQAILVKASPETSWSLGMALPTSRDFTIFGGKIDLLEGYPYPVSFPYFLPFSIPQPSFVSRQDVFSSSQILLEYNLLLIKEIDGSLGRQLTIADLINSGFGVPATNLQSLSRISTLPSPETTPTEYLQYCQQLLEQNSQKILEEITNFYQ